MKRILLSLTVLLAACSSAPPPTVAQKPVVEQYAYGNSDCGAQAENKLKLFDRPDTYPISAEERNNARSALYTECMNARGAQVAGIPRSDTQQQASVQDLASLSPAAGGNYPQAAQVPAYGNGSTVIMVQGNNVGQLASLSPSAGGVPSQIGGTPYSTGGSTVVVVQAPGAAAAIAAPRPAPVLAAPLAQPIASTAEADDEATYKAAPSAPAKTATQAAPVITAPAHALTAPIAAEAARTTNVPVATANPDTQQLEQILAK